MTGRPADQAVDDVTRWLGMRLPASGVTELDVRPALFNPAGLVSGPVTMALIDYAMATALWAHVTEDEDIATTNISVNYLRSAREGRIRATATMDRRTARAASLRAEVLHEDGTLMATAVGTFAIFARRGH
ncbi:hotdog fold thioesterase [Conexibacter sp. W3-3-2]|uniref:Thioesterase domain-containing protein n=1 Tax=Paraconexibacter algicola TaxID=2133960 RepID=A0A2T4UK82_9ACTN|nr:MULTISPECIES: PaaI family thioesterase [Solirubrobacterales]MTD45964.1 hotdog fold thioesterase [Conexibacter sp. W3-3-2]PTL59625.1 hypothetical protein C7Y72_08170 [Paraconexibacter algicola]